MQNAVVGHQGMIPKTLTSIKRTHQLDAKSSISSSGCSSIQNGFLEMEGETQANKGKEYYQSIAERMNERMKTG